MKAGVLREVSEEKRPDALNLRVPLLVSKYQVERVRQLEHGSQANATALCPYADTDEGAVTWDGNRKRCPWPGVDGDGAVEGGKNEHRTEPNRDVCWTLQGNGEEVEDRTCREGRVVDHGVPGLADSWAGCYAW